MRGDADAPLAATARFFPGLGKLLMSILGLVVALAPVIALIVAKGMRQFVKQHPYWIYIALVVAVVAIVILSYWIYFLLDKNKALKRSEQNMRASLPTDRDREMARKVVNALPPDGDLMRWLKLDFDATSLPASSVRRLGRASETLALSPVDFTDRVAHDSYEACRSALVQFTTTVKQWTKADARGAELRVPDAWKFDQKSQYEAATGAINHARAHLVESYDALLSACNRFRADA